MCTRRQRGVNLPGRPVRTDTYPLDQLPLKVTLDQELCLLPLLQRRFTPLFRTYGLPIHFAETAQVVSVLELIGASVGQRKRPSKALLFCPSS